MKKLFATLSAALLVAGFAVAAEVESGLKAGESVGAYNVKDITGPSAGKSLCYRCQYGSRPVVNVFTRTVNDDLANLIVQVDKLVGENGEKKMAAFVTVLAEDADKVAPQLEALAKKHGIKNVPLTIYDGESGPSEYNISEKADVTVLLWNKGKVEGNVAVAKGGKVDEKVIKHVVADAEKILK